MEANIFVNWIKDLNENSSSSEIFKLAKYDFLKFCNDNKFRYDDKLTSLENLDVYNNSTTNFDGDRSKYTIKVYEELEKILDTKYVFYQNGSKQNIFSDTLYSSKQIIKLVRNLYKKDGVKLIEGELYDELELFATLTHSIGNFAPHPSDSSYQKMKGFSNLDRFDCFLERIINCRDIDIFRYYYSFYFSYHKGKLILDLYLLDDAYIKISSYNKYKAFEMTESFKEPDKNDVLEFIKKINIFILRRGLKIIKTINQKTTKTIENLLNEIDKKNKVSLY